MTRIVTAADLDGLALDGPALHLDGQDFYENHRSCTAHPAFLRIVRGPRGRRSKVAPETLYLVDDQPVTGGLPGIAAALTAFYARQPRPPFDYDAEMNEAGEPE